MTYHEKKKLEALLTPTRSKKFVDQMVLEIL